VRHLGYEEIPLDELNRYPGNARRSDVSAIEASIRRFGQYRSVVVRVLDGQRIILAGNHTVQVLTDMAAKPPTLDELLKGVLPDKREQRERTALELLALLDRRVARCELVECEDDQEARGIVLGDNRLPELGGYDDDALAELLAGMDGDFDGTGFDQDFYDKLTEPEALPDPGDADTGDDLGERWGVIVECNSEAQQTRLLESLSAEGYDVRAIVS
jgi:hypothetical protein